jgi:flagellar FliL protein
MATKGGRTLLLVTIAVGLVSGGTAGVLTKWLWENKPKSGEEVMVNHQEQGEKEAGEEAAHGEHGEAKEIVAKLEPFIVNLADHGVRRQYLRTILHLVLHQERDKKSLEEASPRIRDAVLTLLSSKKTEELLTVEGKTRLREEIGKQINAAIGKEDVVAEVYLVEFLVQ